MLPLRSTELGACLGALHAIGEASGAGEGFARRGVASLRRLAGAELTTLSICNLETGHRSVVSDLPGALSKREIEAFDRHLHEHPLVRDHAHNRHAVTRRISDLVPDRQFRSSALFEDYYRPIRIDHAMAVPIHVDRKVVVGFVFNRSGLDFTDRERASLELIRPHLGDLYRISRAIEVARTAQWAPSPDQGTSCELPLSAREAEVLRWVAGGKTDRDIADILEISPRTIHKHLQRIYEKLGVETRTAAVMRFSARCRARALPH